MSEISGYVVLGDQFLKITPNHHHHYINLKSGDCIGHWSKGKSSCSRDTLGTNLSFVKRSIIQLEVAAVVLKMF